MIAVSDLVEIHKFVVGHFPRFSYNDFDEVITKKRNLFEVFLWVQNNVRTETLFHRNIDVYFPLVAICMQLWYLMQIIST